MKKLIIFLAVVMIGGFACSKARPVEDFATITFFVGEVKKNGADVAIGDVLRENDKIVTGESASCDVRLGESVIRLKEKSVMFVSALLKQGGSENVALGLDMGKLLCKPKKLMKNESFIVRTPTAVAGVRGTKFIVETDTQKTTRIKVFDGKVNVVKRIDKLEQKVGIENILEQATPLEENQKVVITEEEVRRAERKVEQVLQSQEQGATGITNAALIEEVRNDVVIEKKAVQQFRIEDFTNEREEVINVEQREPDVVKQIRVAVQRERRIPEPDGSLLVTRNEIYFIKNGAVMIERKVVSAPAIQGNTLYIASEDYVFSASVEGPVRWRKQMKNDGKVEIKDDSLLVYTNGQPKRLDPQTGETMP